MAESRVGGSTGNGPKAKAARARASDKPKLTAPKPGPKKTKKYDPSARGMSSNKY